MRSETADPGESRRARQQPDMEGQLERPADQVERLQYCINALLSIVALPATWTGGETSQIIGNLLDSLLGMLRLDFVYARLRDSAGEVLEVVRIGPTLEPKPQPQEIGEMLQLWLGHNGQKWPRVVRSAFGEHNISVLPLQLGLQSEIGIIVAGSQRADFPEQTESLLLSVGANQASMVLQEARLRSEHKRTADELDQRVAQRTAELKANDELRKEIGGRKKIEQRVRQRHCKPVQSHS